MSRVRNLKTREEFQELLRGKNNVLLDLYADWCPPCRQLMPILDLLSLEEQNQNIEFVKIKVSDFPEIAQQYEVSSIPTLVFISKDRAINFEKHAGFIELDNLRALINNYFF